MKLEIKNRCTGAVIFSHDCEDNSIKITLVVAIASRVNLIGANLSGADLSYANLSGATGNNSRMSCLQLGAYRIVVLDCEICWGGCTKKTVREWLKYKGEYLSASEQHYLKTVTKPFLRMCLKMECDV